MVKGCEKQLDDRVADNTDQDVVVVDLDGTLVKGNTLHIFFKAAIRDAFRRHDYKFAFVAASLLALRKLKFITHKTMKFSILKRVEITDSLRRDFVRRVDECRRPSVSKILDDYREKGAQIILATAAPDVYVPWIWGEDFVATPWRDNHSRQECRGTVKLAVLRSKIKNFDSRLTAVLTDHHDDLALLGAGAKDIYLVSPSPQSLMTVSLANISFHRLD